MNTIITPLKEGEKVTQKRKREAMLALARLDELRIRRPKPEDDPGLILKMMTGISLCLRNLAM